MFFSLPQPFPQLAQSRCFLPSSLPSSFLPSLLPWEMKDSVICGKIKMRDLNIQRIFPSHSRVASKASLISSVNTSSPPFCLSGCTQPRRRYNSAESGCSETSSCPFEWLHTDTHRHAPFLPPSLPSFFDSHSLAVPVGSVKVKGQCLTNSKQNVLKGRFSFALSWGSQI